MMKKIVSLVVCLALLLAAAGVSLGEEAALKAGTYTATEYGMGGQFDVVVTFSDSAILSVEAPDSKETIMLGTEAIRILSERIVENQSLNLDAVTGATITSNAVLRGVEDCLTQAGGDLEAWKARDKVMVDTYDGLAHEAQILVIGGGLAGVSTAAAAAQNGANVILLEQREFLGGHSVLSTGTLLLGGTTIQGALGIEDSTEAFNNWMLENSQYKKDPVQTALVAENSQAAVDFVLSLNARFNTDQVNATDDSPVNRGHALSPNCGTAFSQMADTMVSLGVDVRLNTRANGFITDDNGEIIGVTATDYYGNPVEYYGDSIVLACGGYAGNREMLLKYWGDKYANLIYGGVKGMDGTMMLAAMEFGADTVDLDNPHLDATEEYNTGINITSNVVCKCGGIIIRQSTAQRFANEQTSHAEVAAAAMLEIGDPYYYEIFDAHAFNYSEAVGAKLQSYVNMGITRKYDSLEAMAEDLELDPEALKKTIDDFNSSVRGETEDPFGRDRFYEELCAPFYAIKVGNGVATTTGGLKVNENLQVMDVNGEVIPNLYAVGEEVGGFRINYIGGSALSHAVITGMLVGRELSGN